jgi:uncharacterized protein YdbL (DUF1318 family)
MTLKLLFAAGMLAVAGTAWAQTAAVDQARAAGTVGERFDGYMGVAGPISGTVRSQVATINIQRRSLYSRLAAQRGATPQDVGVTAGCTLLGRVPVGGAYLLGDNVWRHRAAGQAAPQPDYCG